MAARQDAVVGAAVDKLDRAARLHAQATRLREACVPGQAARAARRALALFEGAEGPAHPDVAHVLLELGQRLELGDSWADGLRCYQRADTILKQHARARDRTEMKGGESKHTESPNDSRF